MNQKYHRRDVLDALMSFVEEYDRFPTVHDLDNAPREFFPSYHTVKKHFGSLRVAKRSTMIELNRRKKVGLQLRLP